MPGVLEYFYATTPVCALGALNIGSRPSHRQSTDLSKHSIRAIPWVFGWAQSRHTLPGWFGLGSALRAFSAADKMNAAQLQRMYQDWPFFRSLIDNTQMALAKADMETAAEYASLAQNTAQGEAIIARVRSEYAASTEQALLVSEQHELLGAQPQLALSLMLRRPYLGPLNHVQIVLLRRLQQNDADETSTLLIRTINAIASGMRNTG